MATSPDDRVLQYPESDVVALILESLSLERHPGIVRLSNRYLAKAYDPASAKDTLEAVESARRTGDSRVAHCPSSSASETDDGVASGHKPPKSRRWIVPDSEGSATSTDEDKVLVLLPMPTNVFAQSANLCSTPQSAWFYGPHLAPFGSLPMVGYRLPGCRCAAGIDNTGTLQVGEEDGHFSNAGEGGRNHYIATICGISSLVIYLLPMQLQSTSGQRFLSLLDNTIG
ncbi:hypothetical protein RJ55_02931 [Drechmeria coniospora]|nr:hypothetical protein RJ55_02931 [Drechmeria coniospora]